MFSKEGVKSLMDSVLADEPYFSMNLEQLNRNIDIIVKYIEALAYEYAYRAHQENGMEGYDEKEDIKENTDELKRILKILENELQDKKKENANVSKTKVK